MKINTIQNYNYQNNRYPSFGANVKFSGPIKELTDDTHKFLNLYMSNILHSTIDVSDEKISNYFTDVFKNLISDSNNEKVFYKNLSEKVKEFIAGNNLIKSNNRINCYADRTMTMFQGHELPKDAVYIDIGCGNGIVTKSIIESLNIKANKTFGLEISDPKDIKGIKVLKFDGENIPEELPKSDFVTLFTVLHHTKDEKQANNLLKSVYNKMNDGGYLLIREHEAENRQDIAFWKIVHDLNTKIMGRTASDLNNGTLYLSSQHWQENLENIGFKFIKKWHDLSYNKQSSYFMLVQK